MERAADHAAVAFMTPSGRTQGERQPGGLASRGFVARVLMPLWVCVGLVLALIVAGPEAAASPAGINGTPGVAAPGSTDEHPRSLLLRSTELRRAAHKTSSIHELAWEPEPEPEDDKDSFETLATDCTLALVSFFEPSEDPHSPPTVETGRLLVSTGLSRGPPR